MLEGIESQIKVIMDNTIVGFYLFQGGRLLYANSALARMFGYEIEELVGGLDPLDLVHPEDREFVREQIRRRLKGEIEHTHYVFRGVRRDGRIVWCEAFGGYTTYEGKPAVVGMLIDVTYRKESEKRLEAFAFQQQALADLGRVALAATELKPLFEFAVDLVSRTLGVDFCKILELARDKSSLRVVAGTGWKDGSVHGAVVGAGRDSQAGYTILSGSPVVVEDLGREARFKVPQLLREHGAVSGVSVVIGKPEEPFGVLGVHTTFPRDFTESEVLFLQSVANILADAVRNARAEEDLRRSEEKYKSLIDDVIESSNVGIFILDSDFKVVWINGATESIFGLDREEVIGKDKRRLVKDRIMHMFDDPEGFAEKVLATYDNNTYVENFECHILPGTNREERWLEHWSQPIKKGLFAGGRIEHYYDITRRKKAEQALERSRSKLRDLIKRLGKTLEQVILAFASAVEKRDPYTAGHQRRVAQLALAIGKKMGLSRNQCRGIYFAGLIHDIGKISIPAEVLNRPGKLERAEMGLIKSHPLVGYEILKDIEFPWPISDIVLQHHERLDGSGYPRGLKNGDILLEARIIAVADVVEAMASHRPYRPALGVEVALEEIKKGKGILYDPQVVEACIEVFKEGFSFQD